MSINAKQTLVGNMSVGMQKYTLPLASAETLGGIKADPVTDNDTQPVHIDKDGKLFTAPGSNFVAQPDAPENTSVLWIDTDDEETTSTPVSEEQIEKAISNYFAKNQFDIRAITVDKSHAGNLIYVSEDGSLSPLQIGVGLKIVNGVISLNCTASESETVAVNIDNDGIFRVYNAGSEVIPVVDENGMISWPGITVSVDSNGTLTFGV